MISFGMKERLLSCGYSVTLGFEISRVCVRELASAAVQIGVNRPPDNWRRQVGRGNDVNADISCRVHIQREAAVGAFDCLAKSRRHDNGQIDYDARNIAIAETATE
jgi:hypothetical protein